MHLASTVLVMLIWPMDILHDASAGLRYFCATREEGRIRLSPMMSLRFGLPIPSDASRISTVCLFIGRTSGVYTNRKGILKPCAP